MKSNVKYNKILALASIFNTDNKGFCPRISSNFEYPVFRVADGYSASSIEGPGIKVTRAIQKWNIISSAWRRQIERETEARNVRERKEGGEKEREREREKRSAGWIRGMTASGCETLGRRGY